MAINKVFNANIVDKITSGENAAVLVNDQKRAINQIIDVVNNVKEASDIVAGTDAVQANYSPAELKSAIDSLSATKVEELIPNGTEAQIVTGTDTTKRKFTPAGINSAIKTIAQSQEVSLAGLAATVPLFEGHSVFLSLDGRSGTFIWTLGDFINQVADDPFQGVYVESDILDASIGVWKRARGHIDPLAFGVVYDDETTAVAEQNLAALQSCIDLCGNGSEWKYSFDRSRAIHIDGTESLVLPQFDAMLVCAYIIGHQTTVPAVVGAATLLPPGNSNYDRDARLDNCTIRSISNSALFMRAWQGDFNNCEFTAPLGRGLWLSGDALSTGNKVRNCYFNGCLIGIFAQEGINKPTDMHILDNRFWTGSGAYSSATQSHILLEGSSGTRFDGNHYYGAVSDHFVKVSSGGSSVRLSNEYYERNSTGSSGALYLAGGNGATYAMDNLSFWCAGNTNPLITINRNVECEMSFDNCKFYDCDNRQLFSMIDSATSQMRIKWGHNNSYTGTIASNSFSDQFLFADYKFMPETITDRFKTVGFGGKSWRKYTYNGSGTGTITLSISTSTIQDASFKFTNDQTVATVTIALSGTASGLGYTIVGQTAVAPGVSVDIVVDKENLKVYVL